MTATQKLSASIEVVDQHEQLLGSGRFTPPVPATPRFVNSFTILTWT